jgi:nitrogen-specific signal transduction histidine kinase
VPTLGLRFRTRSVGSMLRRGRALRQSSLPCSICSSATFRTSMCELALHVGEIVGIRGGRVWLDVAKGPTEAVLTVGDTGRGIPADLLPHVFEPYTTGDAGTEHGLGVGLAIAQQLVELHGGTMRASSAGLGSGSEFVVTLPTCRVS